MRPSALLWHTVRIGRDDWQVWLSAVDLDQFKLTQRGGDRAAAMCCSDHTITIDVTEDVARWGALVLHELAHASSDSPAEWDRQDAMLGAVDARLWDVLARHYHAALPELPHGWRELRRWALRQDRIRERAADADD